jgi:predicted negative regulator of RcsB-dependent stress response
VNLSGLNGFVGDPFEQELTMATERVIEREVPVERVGSGGGGNAVAIIFGFVILAAVIVGGFFLWSYQQNDNLRTSAVTHAASSVSKSAENAASSVGNAADNVAEAVTPNR